MELKRTIPVLGHQQWNISSRAAAKDSFAQRIMRKYDPSDEYGLPSVSFVHYQPFPREDDREKLVQLVQVLMAFNRFSALSIKHSYEIRYYSMLKTQCEQLFSSLHMNPFPHPALKELHLVYSTLLSRYGHVISREEPGIREWLQRIGTGGMFQNVQEKNAWISGENIREKPEKKNLGQREGGQDWEEEGESHSSKEAEREWDQERQEQIEQELIQIQEQIGHTAAFLNPSKNIALPTRRLDSGTRFNWKSEQAKQFFWRVQRASVSEQELILSALHLHSLSGLMDQLKRVNEEQWIGVSRQIQERIWLFLENREAISWISSGKGWFRQTARREIKTEAEKAAHQTADQGPLQRIDNQTAARYLHLMDTGWYQSVMEAVSYLNLEEWQELKRETLSWISVKHGKEPAVADSLAERQEEHRTAIDSLTERQEEHRTGIDSLTERQEGHHTSIESLTEGQEEYHTSIESLTEKQEEHNMAVLQMSEEKQMLFEQLNRQKEELQEILQAGGSGAGDLPGKNVSSAELLENILSVRQRFQESRVLSKHLNWEKKEEERLHSFWEILRQMPDPEWSRLQEELSVIQEKDLYWNLRQSSSDPGKKMEKEAEEAANQTADQGPLQRIDKQTAAKYLYFMDAGWYPLVMEAVSQLNLEEWQELKRETLSWISAKHKEEPAAADSLEKRQEDHRTAIDSLTERQEDHRTAIDSLTERQEKHHTSIESLTEKQEEHNMAVLQMSEEKQMLFEQLNQQKEELQEILQAGRSAAGDLPGGNVSLAELLENILSVRQHFQESQVLSKYLNWEEEEWIDSLQEILRQMPESEWGRLQEELPITQGNGLYWDLRQSILDRKRTEFVSLLMELRQDTGKTEDGAAARPFDEQQPAIPGTAGILIPMIEEGIRRTVIRKEKADRYQSMMEAISYLDTEEWNTLKAEVISAVPASFAFPSDPLPVWEEKQALIFALEKRKQEISAIPHMSQPDEGKDSEAWERAVKNSQVLSSYIKQRQTEIFDKQSEESRTESFHVQKKTDLIFRKESVKQSLLGMDEENWNYFCREMQTLFEENPRQIETNTAVNKKTLINREERLLEEHRTVRSVDEREETALLHWLREHNEGTILFSPLRNVREKLSRMPVLSGEWMGKEPGIQAALQVMEEHRERRMVLHEPVFSREQLWIQEEAVLRRGSSSQEELALRGEMAFREDAPLQEMASSQRKKSSWEGAPLQEDAFSQGRELSGGSVSSRKGASLPRDPAPGREVPEAADIPVYDPASMVTAKGQSGRADSSQALPPQIRREVQTQVTRQVEEQTDIRFITRVRNAEQQGQGASREELEQMEKQLARQKQELEQLKQQQSLPAGPDAGQLSKTVLKKLQNQLRQEQLRHGR